MKSTTNNRSSELQAGNRQRLEAAMKGMEISTNALGVLVLIADMLDEITKGHNLYMVLGSTQNATAFTLSVKGDMTPGTLYAASLEELGVQALDLL